MKITEVITFLENSSKSTRKKSEKKHYRTYIALLTDLAAKELTKEEFELIEKELSRLQLGTRLSFKQLHRNFSKLKQFLKIKFSLTEEGHYTSLGIAIGMCMGIAFGSIIERFLGASIGMTVGMAIGIVIGKTMDAKADVNGTSLKTKLL